MNLHELNKSKVGLNLGEDSGRHLFQVFSVWEYICIDG